MSHPQLSPLLVDARDEGGRGHACQLTRETAADGSGLNTCFCQDAIRAGCIKLLVIYFSAGVSYFCSGLTFLL